MKVGVLTFHNTDNYGAMLQAYALVSYIKQYGHDVYIIDYYSDYLQRKKYVKRNFKYFLVDIIKKIILWKELQNKQKRFQLFRKSYFNLLSCDKIGDLDLVIIGSDQVWATKLTGYDSYFFGANITIPKISYAASCGNIKDIDERTINMFRRFLPSFEGIAVREKTTANSLSSLTQVPMKIVLDPTLLVENQIYSKIQKQISTDNYILVYDSNNKDVFEFSKKISKTLHCKVIALTCDIGLKSRNYSIPDVGVGEFLGYFKNARLIISTSYHGCAMSISYEKDFYCINTGSVSSRSLELLRLLNIEDRYVSLDKQLIINSIDYSRVNVLLNKFRSESVNYLNKWIEKKL